MPQTKNIPLRGREYRVRPSTLEDELFIEKMFGSESEKFKNLQMTLRCTQVQLEAQPGVYRGLTQKDAPTLTSADVMRLEREQMLLDIPEQDPLSPALVTVLTQLPKDAPQEVRDYLLVFQQEASERAAMGSSGGASDKADDSPNA